MMWAIVGILKIIGWTLVILLALILLLLLAILFVSICYQAEGTFLEGKPGGWVKFFWLFHILSVHVAFEEKTKITVRLFGIPVRSLKRKKKSRSQPETSEDYQEQEDNFSDSPEEVEEGWEDGNWEDNGLNEPDWNAEEEDDGEETVLGTQELGESQKGEGESSAGSRIKGVFSRILKALKNIPDLIRRMESRLKDICQKKEKITAWIRNEENQASVRLFLVQLKKLLRHILPRKGQAKITFGLGEDPYLTGRILTYVSPFYALYAEHIELYPEFDRKVLEIEGRCRGRIRIGFVLGYVVRLLFDKNIRKIVRAYLER